jgi:hypothetical protein
MIFAVNITSKPFALQHQNTLIINRTTTRDAPDYKARSATRTTMGLPPISANGLLGKRVDARRAVTAQMVCLNIR